MVYKKLFDYGERLTMQKFLDNVGTLTLKLFTAPTTLTDAMVAGDFTFATFTGSTPITMTGGALAAGNPGGNAVITWDEKTFTKGSGGASEDIAGYVAVDSTGAPVFGETFDPVKTMGTTGDSIAITPKFLLHSEF